MNRIQLKQRARELVKTAKPSPVVAGLIFAVMLLIFGLLISRLSGVKVDTRIVQDYFLNFDMEGFYAYVTSQFPTPVEMLLSALLSLLELILSAGFTIFILNTVNGTEASLWNLLDGFSSFFRIIWLSILSSVFVFLWSLLLIVPGIIAVYKYRLALYLLLENPNMRAIDCLRESKRLMRGHKWQLFVLDLSFIGWFILCGIPYVGTAVRVWTAPFYRTSCVLFYKQRLAEDAAPNLEF